MAIAEIIAGIVLILLAACFLVEAVQLPPSLNPMDVGSAAFPTLILIAMVLFSLALVASAVKKLNKKDEEKIVLNRGKSILLSVAILFIYTALIPLIGFYVSTTVCLVALLLSAGERSWKHIVYTVVFFLLFSKVGFEILCQVPLP
jgi:hypothetical protein